MALWGLFLLFALLATYSYAIYPLCLMLFPTAARRPQCSGDHERPFISVIIAAHNEEQRIREKLANTLALDYPAFEVLVASDCSTDGTDEIVAHHPDGRVELVRVNERNGKEYAQYQALQRTRGDIIVFSDAGAILETNALDIVARAMADPDIGALSSEDVLLTADGNVAGEGLYVRYEMWLRRLESDRYGLVGMSGSLFAVRRSLCDRWDTESPSDFVMALTCRLSGLRSVSLPEFKGMYRDLQNPRSEYERKVRTVLRGMHALRRHPKALSPTLGGFAFQVWSHKVARWAAPLGFVGVLVTSMLLAPSSPLMRMLVLAQGVFYCTAAVVHFSPREIRITPLRTIYFFVQSNLGILRALTSFVSGRKQVAWTPSRR